MALKEITELAVSDTFSGCSSKDLSSLEFSVAWIKGKCLELNNFKISSELEIVNLKQTIQELEKIAKTKNEELKTKNYEIEKIKSDLEEFEALKSDMDNTRKEFECLQDFKVKIKGLGLKDDSNLFDNVYEKLKTSSNLKHENEEVNTIFSISIYKNNFIQLRKKHEQELLEQKEEYAKLLREENLKWKLQREELENEISKLKKASTTVKSQKTSNDADLTAFIKD